MKQASVAELKAKLSEYLAAVKRGEDVIVTDRGKPVAKLTPLEKGAGRDARVMELLRAGLMTPARKKLPRAFLDRTLPPVSEGAVAEAIRKEREEGW
jgi:prevent-host-death family protein